jgi:hypothetical protein
MNARAWVTVLCALGVGAGCRSEDEPFNDGAASGPKPRAPAEPSPRRVDRAKLAATTPSATPRSGKQPMGYGFGMSEFATESYAFVHGGLRVGVHLHPVYSDPAAFERYKGDDPILAWIFVRREGSDVIAYKLNAAYDEMMGANPFFLNQDEGWGGHNIDGTKRASLWTRAELDAAITGFLDRQAPR